MAKRKKILGGNEDIIADALRSSDENEQIRVQLHSREGVMGYAIEVTRLIKDEEYSYVGWISMMVFKTNCEPWQVDQRMMIEAAFKAAIKEVLN